ncbi:hypothetical protein [Pseudonocardia sp.]|uniref:hypothetical protein n=1 Tax=Pseudonocardia sp. TaxID=60912 RepID=UPI003D09B49D
MHAIHVTYRTLATAEEARGVADAFVAGPLLGALRDAPDVSEVAVRGYAVDGEATARTAPFLRAAA